MATLAPGVTASEHSNHANPNPIISASGTLGEEAARLKVVEFDGWLETVDSTGMQNHTLAVTWSKELLRPNDTSQWRVRLDAESSRGALNLTGVWMPVYEWRTCTLVGGGGPNWCWNRAEGPLNLTGTLGDTKADLAGWAYDEYCTKVTSNPQPPYQTETVEILPCGDGGFPSFLYEVPVARLLTIV